MRARCPRSQSECGQDAHAPSSNAGRMPTLPVRMRARCPRSHSACGQDAHALSSISSVSSERGASGVADVDNSHGVIDDPVEDTILGNRHHPQRRGITPCGVTVGETHEGIARIADAFFVGGCDGLASGGNKNFPAKAQPVQANSWSKLQPIGHNARLL